MGRAQMSSDAAGMPAVVSGTMSPPNKPVPCLKPRTCERVTSRGTRDIAAVIAAQGFALAGLLGSLGEQREQTCHQLQADGGVESKGGSGLLSAAAPDTVQGPESPGMRVAARRWRRWHASPRSQRGAPPWQGLQPLGLCQPGDLHAVREWFSLFELPGFWEFVTAAAEYTYLQVTVPEELSVRLDLWP